MKKIIFALVAISLLLSACNHDSPFSDESNDPLYEKSDISLRNGDLIKPTEQILFENSIAESSNGNLIGFVVAFTDAIWRHESPDVITKEELWTLFEEASTKSKFIPDVTNSNDNNSSINSTMLKSIEYIYSLVDKHGFSESLKLSLFNYDKKITRQYNQSLLSAADYDLIKNLIHLNSDLTNNSLLKNYFSDFQGHRFSKLESVGPDSLSNCFDELSHYIQTLIACRLGGDETACAILKDAFQNFNDCLYNPCYESTDPCCDVVCTRNKECINGECVLRCEFVICPPRMQCVQGVCVSIDPPHCDQDCPRGYRCILGECIPIGGCRSDRDCPKGFVCSNKRCIPL